MSNYNFYNGQSVRITEAHNHLNPCNDTIYQVGAINRIQGSISVQLLHEGKVCGAIPETKLAAK